MNTKINFYAGCFIILSLTAMLIADRCYIPTVDDNWWQVASTPELERYQSDKQQPVDFALWQAADGSWQIWSCIRFTNLGGHTRLFYRWEGRKLTDKGWAPRGIVMEANPQLGEPLGGLQAPHVIKTQGRYWMIYGDWDNIRLATSNDGKKFTRLTDAGVIFSEGPNVNNRDPMLLFTQDKWHCYYTAFPARHGYVFCRTSDNLLNWSDSFIVSYGGKAGNNPYSCECPHVVELMPDSYFLFRTQYYGPGAQTTIYQSGNPLHFGIDNDSGYVCQLNLCAPEIVKLDDKYYIAALNPNLDGIRITRLHWKCYDQPVFDFDNPDHRSHWQLKSGNLNAIFTNSIRTWFHPRTEYFIATAETEPDTFDDSLTGQIESPVFYLTRPHCLLYLSGGQDTERLQIKIIDGNNGTVYFKTTGNNSNQLEPVQIDCQAFLARPLILLVIDQSSDPWGHINLGGIYQANPERDL